MKQEFEMIFHRAGDYKIFLVNLLYRTPHVHKDFEICLLLEGSVRLMTKGSAYSCEKGDLWALNPLESHELIADEPALILSLQISPDFFADIFPQIKNMEFSCPVICPDVSKDAPAVRLSSLLLSIADAYFSRKEEAPLRCAGLICLLFEDLLACLPCCRVSEKERQLSAQKAQRIRKICDYMDQHYSEKLLLTDLARELGLTMSYLSHFFKDSFGLSFQACLMKMRCEKARQLLLLTDFSLLDISIACGFSDIKYFNQGFARQFGCSPRQYRSAFEREELSRQQKSMLSTQDFLSPAASRMTLGRYLR